MAGGNKEAETKQHTAGTVCCSFCSILVMVMVIGVSIMGLMSKALKVADMLVRFNDRFGETAEEEMIPGIEFGGKEHSVTVLGVLAVVLVEAVVVLVLMLFGMCGAALRNRCVVSVSLMATLFFALELLFVGVFVLTRYESIDGTLIRQSEFFCNSTSYLRLTANMDCYASDVVKPECGEICKERVATLKKFDGCEMLSALCERWTYEDSLTECKGYHGADGKDCLELCDKDFTCQGFMADTEAWECIKVGKPMGVPGECFGSGLGEPAKKKVLPLAIKRFEETSFAVSMALLVASPILMLTTLFMCCLSYQINHNADHKPAATNLCCVVFCPCCAGNRGRGYTTYDDGVE
mmetsp:Transcript_104639/g.200916  ORF Transcript_104639/g.200916 Transcript_104639/m.200916 type:complete len:351 (+) Transcript_104639:84-1136(+)